MLNGVAQNSLNHRVVKVAVVYPFFAHYRGPIINALNNNGQITFHFLSGTKRSKPYSSLKLYDFDNNSNHIVLNNIWFGKFFLYQKNLLKVLKLNNYDAVIFLGDWKYISIFISLFYLKRKNIPFLFWSHGILNTKRTLNNFLKLSFFKLFDKGGFVYDNRAKNNLKKMGYNKPISVIYNSLDYDRQKEILEYVLAKDTPDIISEYTPYLIFSGRVIKERKLELLFDALSILKRRKTKIKLIVFGDGPYLSILEKYAEEMKIQEMVIFKGECYDESVLAEYFINAVACVYPGPIGLTAIHSLTYGTPVITNDYIDGHKPEIESIIDNVTGLFFKDNKADSLSEKIEEVLSFDSNKRKAFRENAYRVVQDKFTPKNQMEIICDRLQTLSK